MNLIICQLIPFLFIRYTNGQLAAMVEGMLNAVYRSGPTTFDGIMSQERSPKCEWGPWNRCVWPSSTKDLKRRRKSGKYLDLVGGHCKKHWFYQLLGKAFATPLNNVFDYILNAMTQESKRAPCGLCAYRQSCGHKGVDKCHRTPLAGRRPSIVPLHVKEQLCTERRGLQKSQAEPCQLYRAVLQWNNPADPCQAWPAAESNLRLPGLPDQIKSILYTMKWISCLPDYQERSGAMRVDGPFKGRKYPLRCRCCCYPFEPKLVRNRGSGRPEVWRCKRMREVRAGGRRRPVPRKPRHQRGRR